MVILDVRTLGAERIETRVCIISAVAVAHVTQEDSREVSSTLVDLAEADHQRAVAGDEHDGVIGNQLVVVVPATC